MTTNEEDYSNMYVNSQGDILVLDEMPESGDAYFEEEGYFPVNVPVTEVCEIMVDERVVTSYPTEGNYHPGDWKRYLKHMAGADWVDYPDYREMEVVASDSEEEDFTSEAEDQEEEKETGDRLYEMSLQEAQTEDFDFEQVVPPLFEPTPSQNFENFFNGLDADEESWMH